MASHVAFLRAINTGSRRITNPELAAAVSALGFDDVTVYQASGNVLLGGRAAGDGDAIAHELTAGLTAALGYDVPAVVRSAAEVRQIVDAEPFPGRSPSPESKPQVMLMQVSPSAEAVAGWSTDADRLAVVERDVHWWPMAGISTSALDVRGFEATFGAMTVRTLGTIQRISAKLS